MEEKEQATEATHSEEEVVLDLEEGEATEDGEAVETLKQKLADAEEAKRQLTARAKKAEAQLKDRPRAAEAPQPTSALSKDEAELLILASQGLTDAELVNELKALAKVRGTSLIETTKDPIFIALQKAREDEAKAEKAKLPASRGSTQAKKEKEISAPGLSDAEHKELWKQQNGR